MGDSAFLPRQPDGETPEDRVESLSRDEVSRCTRWARAFASQRKDYRYYALIEDTICPEFDYRYFGLRDPDGEICAIQPFFLLDQDVLASAGPRIRAVAGAIRRVWKRFLVLRTLMVGCAAGEGHLDDSDPPLARRNAEFLAGALRGHARRQRAAMIVLKEFPARYRHTLACLEDYGFTRIPSFPMTRLNIEYASFDEYLTKALNSSTRAKLRKKFRAAEQAAPIELEIVTDVSPIIDDVYPLYLQVYERARLRFEKLTKAYFCELGRRMPDKVRFFLWRQRGRLVAFTLCMTEAESIYAEYIGLDYAVALDLHLYHYAVRDMMVWAMANGYRWFRSSALNYDPKLHMRHKLDPLDLYVRHTSPLMNTLLRRVLPLLEPARSDKTLRKFANYQDLWTS